MIVSDQVGEKFLNPKQGVIKPLTTFVHGPYKKDFLMF